MSGELDVGHRWEVSMDRSAVVASEELPLMAGDGSAGERIGSVKVVAIRDLPRGEHWGTHNFADPVAVTVEVVELRGERSPREAKR